MTTPLESGLPIVQSDQKMMPARAFHLRKHADYQRVYRTGSRQSLPLMTYFFALRVEDGGEEILAAKATNISPRIGLTTGRALGKAVNRNRIKRRMREAVRRNLKQGALTGPVDVVLHPRRSVLQADFAKIEREVARAFQAIQQAMLRTSQAKTANAAGDAEGNTGNGKRDAS